MQGNQIHFCFSVFDCSHNVFHQLFGGDVLAGDVSSVELFANSFSESLPTFVPALENSPDKPLPSPLALENRQGKNTFLAYSAAFVLNVHLHKGCISDHALPPMGIDPSIASVARAVRHNSALMSVYPPLVVVAVKMTAAATVVARKRPV